MKNLNILLAASAISLFACDHPMSFHTKVNEDGSLDKTIVMDKIEANKVDTNIFGISEKNNWKVTKTRNPDSTTKSDEAKYRLEFVRHFESADKMNEVLDRNVDTLFQVQSKFEKKFRWFYTYIRYSETIRPINRFKKVFPKNYFTIEDSLFIQRLPPEGSPISKADSVNLILLNEKISSHYTNMGIFNELFPVLEQVVRNYNQDKKWGDTLYRKRERIYELINKDQGNFLSAKKIADELHIPLPKEADKDFDSLSKEFNSRLNFMSFSRDGKYAISFAMPWAIVNTNADSVAANYAVWKPVMHKFAFSNYEMYAESRKLNIWAVIVSVGIVGLTVFVLRKRN
ncbi:MAG: hypothetical protein JST69_04560 [Bacteroidetes bacterium]|nr:hypothetical protein [Bacteroidota bacterium]